MPTWISSLLLLVTLLAPPAGAEVVTRLPVPNKVVALTFDGCEAPNAPAWLDAAIVRVLEAEKVPATLFVTGLFARRNRAELARLAGNGLVTVENHSFDHPRHMERLDAGHQHRQVEDTDREIEAITGRKPRFFRFPGGNHDEAALERVERLGLRVVHWRLPSGDPAPGLTPARLTEWVLSTTRPGDVLIFHINGRAPATAAALPGILQGLRQRGYGFVGLDEVLK